MLIYCITNKVNGKQYIGLTTQPLKKRWARHCWFCSADNMVVGKAIQKYGAENFSIKIIMRCSDIDKLKKMERFFIWAYNSISPNGYNLTSGGERFEHNEVTKKRMRESQLGKAVSEITRKRLSQSHIGIKHSPARVAKKAARMKGKRLSEAAYKNSLLKTQKSYRLIDSNGEIIQITNMAKFCRENDYSKSRMSELVNGRRVRYRGWILFENNMKGKLNA